MVAVFRSCGVLVCVTCLATSVTNGCDIVTDKRSAVKVVDLVRNYARALARAQVNYYPIDTNTRQVTTPAALSYSFS